MPTPATAPDPHAAHGTDSHGLEADQPIWVYRNGSWRPGVILNASPRAALVRYRPTESQGTAVDTVDVTMLAHRHEHDPLGDTT